MTKEEQLVEKRVQELSGQAYRKNIVVFSDFLNLHEQHILHQTLQGRREVHCQGFGGYDSAERQIFAFIPDALCYAWEYPLECIRVEPLQEKFAEPLTHRDFLGAILNLGIDRAKIGDILVRGLTGYFFCHSVMSEFLLSNLVRVRHTTVRTMRHPLGDVEVSHSFQELEKTVASLRVDCVAAAALNVSRSALEGLIRGQKVFINAKLVVSGHTLVKEQDIISVRGYGRFLFEAVCNSTKKGRIHVKLQKYL